MTVQRQADPARVPADLPCPTSSDPPEPLGTGLIFPAGGATVDPPLGKLIESFVNIWNRVRTTQRNGAGDNLVVDGYASVPGSQALNWRLSCQRAENVRDAVARQIGVVSPASNPAIDVFAHGETTAFHPDPLRNQRAVIWPRNLDGYRGTANVPASGTGPGAYPGLGARKQSLVSAGGTDLDLAAAMLETERMLADYPFGDTVNGVPKTGDSACFGIFRQNWYFIRTSGAMPALPGPTQPGQGPLGLAEADWHRGGDLNSDLTLDVRVLHASQAQLGVDQWFAAHRWGTSGREAFARAVAGSTSAVDRARLADIGNYQNAVEWILGQIRAHPALRTNDQKVWVDVPAV